MPYPKIKKIEEFYKIPFNTLAVKLYCDGKLSSIEISEKFLKEAKISISPRHIQRIIKSLGKDMKSLKEIILDVFYVVILQKKHDLKLTI